MAAPGPGAFRAVSLAPRSTDQAKEGLLVVWGARILGFIFNPGVNMSCATTNANQWKVA